MSWHCSQATPGIAELRQVDSVKKGMCHQIWGRDITHTLQAQNRQAQREFRLRKQVSQLLQLAPQLISAAICRFGLTSPTDLRFATSKPG